MNARLCYHGATRGQGRGQLTGQSSTSIEMADGGAGRSGPGFSGEPVERDRTRTLLGRGLAYALWSAAAVAALLWPARIPAPLDGVPLDGRLEAVLLGVALPVLWACHPAFLRSRRARGLVIALLAWKVATAVLLGQGGWCGRFETDPASPGDRPRVHRSWDLRTDWRAAVPSCSAIVARPYPDFHAFPAWFTNFPGSRASLRLEMQGYLVATRQGVIEFDAAPPDRFEGTIEPIGAAPIALSAGAPLIVSPGVYHVRLRLGVAVDRARFVPRWDGADLWRAVPTTIGPPSGLDRALGRLGRWVTPALVALLLLEWGRAALVALRPNAAVLGGGAALVVGLGLAAGNDRMARFAPLLFFGALAVPVARSLRNERGVLLLLGVPWLALFTVRRFTDIGRFTSYWLPDDDWTLYQWFAQRIFMEGYWLEGGEPTLWHQPLYRWIVGVLHLVFGDSSVGEVYADALWLLVGALFAFRVAKIVGGFRWGLVAAAMTLAVFTLGPIWHLIGRGLTEITGTGWLYLAGFCLLCGRANRRPAALAAAVLATLAFYTRMNYVLVVAAAGALTLPLRAPAALCWSPRVLSRRMPWGPLAVYLGGVAVGIALLAVRTWYYTGFFSLFAGTQRRFLATGIDSAAALTAPVLARVFRSVWMVATVADPGRLNLRGLPVTAGFAVAALAVFGVPPFRRLPLGPTVVCLSLAAGPILVMTGSYQGRASVHAVPVAVALFVIGLRSLDRLWQKSRSWKRRGLGAAGLGSGGA